MEETSKTYHTLRKIFFKISHVISSHLFVFKVCFFVIFKQKFPQNKKLKPFFQPAHKADSKNAKKFEKTLFFKEI